MMTQWKNWEEWCEKNLRNPNEFKGVVVRKLDMPKHKPETKEINEAKKTI